MNKKLTRSQLIKRIDRLRQTFARYDGAYKKHGVWFNKCVTCGKEVECSKSNGGHFIPRSCQPLRWDEKNVHCQCVQCNLYHNGAYISYSQWFIKKYGQETFDHYANTFKAWRSGKMQSLRMDELRTIHDEWLEKIRKLEKKTGPLVPASWSSFGPAYLE